MKLGSWLIAKGRVSGAQLKRALLDQSFYGGRLSTSLIKLGYLDEATLGEYLAELFRVPYAGPAKFENIPPDVLRMVPRQLAEKHHILPVAVSSKKLQLVMMNPRDILVADEVAFLTGLQVEPWVSSENLLLSALERYHQVPRHVRETIPITESRRGTPIAERPSSQPPPAEPLKQPPSGVPSAQEELGLDGRPLSASAESPPPGVDWDQAGHWETFATSPAAPSTHDPVPGAVSASSEAPTPAKPTPHPEPTPPAAAPPSLTDSSMRAEAAPLTLVPALPPPTLDEASQRLRDSDDRDEVFDALLSFCAGRLRRAAVFVVLQERVMGWSGRGDGLEAENVRAAVIPFSVPSIFSYFRMGSDFYFGPVPDLPANQKFYQELSIPPPDRVLLVPLHIKGRLIAILYGDGGPKWQEEPDIALFRRLAQKASLALEILILRNKIMMS